MGATLSAGRSRPEPRELAAHRATAKNTVSGNTIFLMTSPWAENNGLGRPRDSFLLIYYSIINFIFQIIIRKS
jgi:hypothetical protein